MNQPKKTILIIGGAGYIGSHVNLRLHAAGLNTIVFDNLSTGSSNAVICGTFYQGDLSQTEALKTIFSNHSIDAVMHFAGSSDVKESVVSPGKYFKNNVANTLNLLEAMLEHKVKLLIFSSSASVYGISSQQPLTENAPIQPINPYGETKVMIEKMLHWFQSCHGIRYCSLRYFNAAGGDPYGKLLQWNHQDPHIIPMILKKLTFNQPLTLNGIDYLTPDGTCVRDYIHVDDLASAHLLSLQNLLNGKPSNCYNLGIGQGFSVKEVIKATERVTKQKLTLNIAPKREGDPPILVASAEKAKKELGWSPKYLSLDVIIQHALQGMKPILTPSGVFI